MFPAERIGLSIDAAQQQGAVPSTTVVRRRGEDRGVARGPKVRQRSGIGDSSVSGRWWFVSDPMPAVVRQRNVRLAGN